MSTGVRRVRNFFLLAWMVGPGLASAAIWQDLNNQADAAARGLPQASTYYRALQADEPMLRQSLMAAPLEETASQGAVLELPMPNGSNHRFEVVNSPILSPGLAARYPEISTYAVTGIDDPAISGRLDMLSSGFHAMLSTPEGTVFIGRDDAGNYRSYYKQDYAAATAETRVKPVCHLAELDETGADAPLQQLAAQRAVSTNSRRTYRLAMVTTGEYGRYFGSESATVNSLVTAVNRINQIYGRDLAIQLQLVDVIAYLTPDDDPFSSSMGLADRFQTNQDVLDYAVGLDNYDIGHLVDIAGGGVASLGSTCTNIKAYGYTGYPTPDIGDPFYIDFIAHEIGHQLNATHTFNGSVDNCAGDNRTPSTAVEPGSGSTIMAYAGICGAENLQDNSDATFHAASIDQINSFAFSGTGASCGIRSATGNSLPATIDAGPDVTIPMQTPFVLTGSTSPDPDGNTLSYQWDQIDANGTATDGSTVDTDQGDNPLFRSFVPKGTPTRYFPRLSSLLAATTDIGETLPTTARTLNFRMTVRDGKSGVGDDDRRVTVTAQGPFQITGGVLNSATDLSGGSMQTLAWDVNHTDTSCPTVSVSLLSLSGDDSTYCDQSDDANLTLATGISNNGNASVTLPSAQIARARVMLTCDNNVFFAISDSNFSVNSATTPIASDCKTTDGEPLEHGEVFVSASSTGSRASSGGGGGALFLLPLWLGLGILLRLAPIAFKRG
jgi:hypothetical protein